MFWSDLGNVVGFEAIGLIDAQLPTAAIFAKNDTKRLAIHDSNLNNEKLDHKETETPSTSHSGIEVSQTPENCTPVNSIENFNRGVIFYMQEKKIVGILLWNLFNRIAIARKILMSDDTFEDLNEVAKLFDIYDAQHNKEI